MAGGFLVVSSREGGAVRRSISITSPLFPPKCVSFLPSKTLAPKTSTFASPLPKQLPVPSSFLPPRGSLHDLTSGLLYLQPRGGALQVLRGDLAAVQGCDPMVLSGESTGTLAAGSQGRVSKRAGVEGTIRGPVCSNRTPSEFRAENQQPKRAAALGVPCRCDSMFLYIKGGLQYWWG